MKICQACGRENADEMNFCLDCGKTLPAGHPPGWLGDTTTSSHDEMETTVRRGGFETAPHQDNFTAQPPQGGFTVPLQTEGAFTFSQPPSPRQSNRRLLVVVGGLASLLLLIVVGAAGVIGYKYYAASKGESNSNSNANISTNSSPGTKGSPSPAPSFTPPTEATKSGTFTVSANAGWQLSELATVPREEFRTKVEGKIDLSGIKTGVGPGGMNDAGSKSRRTYPEFPTGALLMRTHYADGKTSNIAAVSVRSTGSWVNYPDERGKIEFCINDNAPEKNGGQFTVTLTMTKMPK